MTHVTCTLGGYSVLTVSKSATLSAANVLLNEHIESIQIVFMYPKDNVLDDPFCNHPLANSTVAHEEWPDMETLLKVKQSTVI
ncbi:hypothetical protein CHS0354_015108 [Potamilus streckersoni]|uniref:Uncharacterized protein n=1 Tax=Potamilus streckersoni TaxID=2493646 RepID=A0AAE0SRW6_9BIVA|nr:hypothetical protein CHS0354_015108 [Potamilus streckersoni]